MKNPVIDVDKNLLEIHRIIKITDRIWINHPTATPRQPFASKKDTNNISLLHFASWERSKLVNDPQPTPCFFSATSKLD